MIIGENINIENLVGYIAKVEQLIDCKIRYLILKEEEIFDLDAR